MPRSFKIKVQEATSIRKLLSMFDTAVSLGLFVPDYSGRQLTREIRRIVNVVGLLSCGQYPPPPASHECSPNGQLHVQVGLFLRRAVTIRGRSHSADRRKNVIVAPQWTRRANIPGILGACESIRYTVSTIF